MNREIEWLRMNSQAMVKRIVIREAACFPEFMPEHFAEEWFKIDGASFFDAHRDDPPELRE